MEHRGLINLTLQRHNGTIGDFRQVWTDVDDEWVGPGSELRAR
jgi:hypothetical protein